jgi:hypothetical protein
LGEEIGQGFYHYASGFLIFLVLVLGLVGLDGCIPENSDDE